MSKFTHLKPKSEEELIVAYKQLDTETLYKKWLSSDITGLLLKMDVKLAKELKNRAENNDKSAELYFTRIKNYHFGWYNKHKHELELDESFTYLKPKTEEEIKTALKEKYASMSNKLLWYTWINGAEDGSNNIEDFIIFKELKRRSKENKENNSAIGLVKKIKHSNWYQKYQRELELDESFTHLKPKTEEEIKLALEKEEYEKEQRRGGKEENVRGLNEVIRFIQEDRCIDDEFKVKWITSLQELESKYQDKLYAQRVIYNNAILSLVKEPWCKVGDKYISSVGIRDVGTYWEYSDLPYLIKHFENYQIKFRISHNYHYIAFENIIRKSKEEIMRTDEGFTHLKSKSDEELSQALKRMCSSKNQGWANLKSIERLPEGISFFNGGSVYLNSLKQLPKVTSFYNGGCVYLNSLEQFPEGTTFSNAGNVYLQSLKQLPKGTIFSNGGYVDLNSLEQLPEDFVYTGTKYVCLKNHKRFKGPIGVKTNEGFTHLKPKSEEEILKSLIDKKMSPDEIYETGIKYKSPEIIKLAVKRGLHPINSGGQSGRLWGTFNNNHEWATLVLLTHFQVENLLIDDNNFRRDVLCKALYMGMLDVTKYLVKTGFYNKQEIIECVDDTADDYHFENFINCKKFIKKYFEENPMLESFTYLKPKSDDEIINSIKQMDDDNPSNFLNKMNEPKYKRFIENKEVKTKISYAVNDYFLSLWNSGRYDNLLWSAKRFIMFLGFLKDKFIITQSLDEVFSEPLKDRLGFLRLHNNFKELHQFYPSDADYIMQQTIKNIFDINPDSLLKVYNYQLKDTLKNSKFKAEVKKKVTPKLLMMIAIKIQDKELFDEAKEKNIQLTLGDKEIKNIDDVLISDNGSMNFKWGFVTYSILKFVKAKNLKGEPVRYTDIVAFVVKLRDGKKYTTKDRGTYSGWFRKYSRLFNQDEHKHYFLNNSGYKRLDKLESKFKDYLK